MAMTDIEWAERYVARIRNKPKHDYAARYLHWLSRNSVGDPPEPIGLGYMGAQAVRMNLDECFRQLGPTARIILRGNLNKQLGKTSCWTNSPLALTSQLCGQGDRGRGSSD